MSKFSTLLTTARKSLKELKNLKPAYEAADENYNAALSKLNHLIYPAFRQSMDEYNVLPQARFEFLNRHLCSASVDVDGKSITVVVVSLVDKSSGRAPLDSLTEEDVNQIGDGLWVIFKQNLEVDGITGLTFNRLVVPKGYYVQPKHEHA